MKYSSVLYTIALFCSVNGYVIPGMKADNVKRYDDFKDDSVAAKRHINWGNDDDDDDAVTTVTKTKTYTKYTHTTWYPEPTEDCDDDYYNDDGTVTAFKRHLNWGNDDNDDDGVTTVTKTKTYTKYTHTTWYPEPTDDCDDDYYGDYKKRSDKSVEQKRSEGSVSGKKKRTVGWLLDLLGGDSDSDDDDSDSDYDSDSDSDDSDCDDDDDDYYKKAKRDVSNKKRNLKKFFPQSTVTVTTTASPYDPTATDDCDDDYYGDKKKRNLNMLFPPTTVTVTEYPEPTPTDDCDDY